MTADEAIGILANGSRDVGEVLQALDMGIAALKKDIPQATRRNGTSRICPGCRWTFGEIELTGISYCPGCGQRIKWRGE